MESNWRKATVDFGLPPDLFIGGHHLAWPDRLIGVFRSNPGGIWYARWNPANLRVDFVFWAAAIPGMSIWEQLETWIGPD